MGVQIWMVRGSVGGVDMGEEWNQKILRATQKGIKNFPNLGVEVVAVLLGGENPSCHALKSGWTSTQP